MATEPDQIRSDIESTRAALASNVDQLADRTNPARAINRGWNRFTDKMHSLSDTVMGAPSSAAGTVKQKAGQAGDKLSEVGDRLGDVAEDAADAVRAAPRRAAEQARGNPLAAGMIAFGAGLLAAALIPESDTERRMTRKLADNELIDQVREPLQQSASQLRQDLTDDVKESGQQLADSAKQHTSSAVDDAKQQVRAVKNQSTP